MGRVNRLFFLTSLYFCGVISLRAQPEGYHLTTIPIPHSESFFSIVGDLSESEDGRIWFTSNYGLYAYDGYFFRRWHPEDSLNFFPESDLRFLSPAGGSEFWVSSKNGHIYRFNTHDHSYKKIKTPFTGGESTHWTESFPSGFTIAGNRGNIFRWEENQWKALNRESLGKTVRLVFEKGHKLWLNIEKNDEVGYLDLRNGTFKLYSDEVGVWALDSTVYTVDLKGRVKQWRNDRPQVIATLPSQGYYLRDGKQDGDKVWLTDNDFNLFSVEANGYAREVSKDIQKVAGKKKINSILPDTKGNLWIGSSRELFLLRKDPKGLRKVLHDPTIRSGEVGLSTRAIVPRDEGGALLTTYAGWYEYNGEDQSLEPARITINDDDNRSSAIPLLEVFDLGDQRFLAVDESDYIGELDLRKGRFRSIIPDLAEVSEYLVTLEHIGDSVFLTGGSNGLYTFDLKSEKYGLVTPENFDFSSTFVWDIEWDGANAWVGTHSGLYRLPSSLRSAEQPPGIGEVKVHDILSFGKSIYAGTEKGLFILQDSTAVEHKLDGYHVFSLLPYGRWLWLGTDQGIVQYDPQNHDCFRYTLQNGISSDELNRKSVAVLDSNLILGGLNGFTVIKPSSFIKKSQIAGDSVMISSLVSRYGEGGEYFPEVLNPLNIRGPVQISFKRSTQLLQSPFMIYYQIGERHYKCEGPLLQLNTDTIEEGVLKIRLRFPDGEFSNVVSLRLKPESMGGFFWYSLILIPLIIVPLLVRSRKKDRNKGAVAEKVPHEKPGESIPLGAQMPVLYVAPLHLPDERTLARIYKVQEIVFENTKDPDLGVPEIAKLFHVSERQLYRLIKEVFAVTPLQYITRLKLSKALFLIYNQEIVAVSDLAFACGFKKASYFSTLFKKRFGRSPKEILKSKYNLTK